MSRSQRADAVRNRQKVVEAAFRAFTTVGPDVSMREVARMAGVGPGTIYRHFPDKESLLAGVVEGRFRSLAAETRQAMDELSPWAAFALIMRRMAEMMTEDRAFAGAVGAARAPAERRGAPETDATARRDQAREELDQVLLELAHAAQASGDLRDDVGPLELGMLLAGIGLLPGPADHAAETPPWDTYLRVALDGLRAGSRGAGDAP